MEILPAPNGCLGCRHSAALVFAGRYRVTRVSIDRRVSFSVLICFLLAPGYGQQSPFDRAQALLKQGKAGDALPILLELHRSAPSNANLCQQIGVAYTQLQDLASAEKFYREAVRLNPQFWAARKNLGTVLWFLDRRDESEREFLVVTKALPDDPVPHLYLGLAAHARRQFPRATLEFEKAGTLASDNPEVLPAVLESYLACRDASFPGKIVDQLGRAENPDPALMLHVGELFLQYGHLDRASAVFENLISAHKDNAEVWRMLAEAYDRQGKPEEAYRAYSKAIETGPSSEDNYISFAEFASAHANNDYALQVVARGLEHLPKSPALLFEQGLLWALKGDRSQADGSFEQASRLKPDWALPLLALGISRLESGDAAKAVVLFQKARGVDPRDARAHYLYATALTRKAGDSRAEAIAALRRAIELNSNDGRPHTLLGQLQLAAGHTDEAAREWQTALKIDPENATALYQLGLLLRKQGKTAEAERLLERFQRVKAKKRLEEESLVQILRVVPEKRAP